jgi:hypothetical protein
MSIEQSNLSIILPVHNEVDSLESVISEWDSSLKNIPGLCHTFLICEDGSTDGTQELITKIEHHYPIVNNSVSWRRGYGQAVRDGIAPSGRQRPSKVQGRKEGLFQNPPKEALTGEVLVFHGAAMSATNTPIQIQPIRLQDRLTSENKNS